MTPRLDPRSRILLYFLLGIALPSGLLGYLAFRGIQNDRALVERERRNELESAAAQFETAFERALDRLEDRVRVAGSGEMADFVRSEAPVEVVFEMDSTGDVRLLAAEGAVFTDDPGIARVSGSTAANSPLAEAKRRELRGTALDEALEAYRRALELAPNEAARGEALAGVARIQRKLGLPEAAIETYERLGTRFGDVRSPAGLPFGAAAALEQGALLAETGDPARAAAVLSSLHRDLLEGRWRLTAAQFDLVAGGVREALETLAAGGSLPGGRDTLRVLAAEEAERREGALVLAAFEQEAERLLGHRTDPTNRTVIDAAGRTFPVILSRSPDPAGAPAVRGFVVDPASLARDVFAEAWGDDAHRVAWTLRPGGGRRTRASTASPAPGSPRVTTSLDGFPPWTLELSLSAAAMDEGFLASRRAVYLWAFVLLAGILLSGLVLTIRSVGRELELARMRSDFVSTVSHEFRSPLTAIRQLAEMLRGGRVPSEERRRQYYDVLLEQSERLTRVVENVLDFARMDAGRRDLLLEPVDLGRLAEDAATDARQRVAHEGFTIRTDVDDALPRARVDEQAVRQALGNLIDNGVKYSGTSRELEVRGFRENGEVVLAVRDFGIGLTPDDRERVFDRFFRGGHELTRSVKGTGLGLTLVKQIMDAHGGTVDVRSEQGEGSTFSLRFPLDGPGTGGEQT